MAPGAPLPARLQRRVPPIGQYSRVSFVFSIAMLAVVTMVWSYPAQAVVWPLLGGRVRSAMPGCDGRGRVLVAFGAHTDDAIVQDELERISQSAASLTCPPHDVALFVDGAHSYTRLRHPSRGATVHVPFGALLKNGSAAFRGFVSHQLLMASVPGFLREDKTYESVWIIEEDSRFAGGNWSQLFASFNSSSADLVAHARKTNRGMASLMAVARVSTRLFRAVSAELANLEARDKKLSTARSTSARKTIHGAFIYGLCQRARWCKFQRIEPDWLAVFRAKCPWSAEMFAQLAPGWPLSGHGRIFHPVKVRARMSGRDFKRFRCATQFQRENVPRALFAHDRSSSERNPRHTRPSALRPRLNSTSGSLATMT